MALDKTLNKDAQLRCLLLGKFKRRKTTFCKVERLAEVEVEPRAAVERKQARGGVAKSRFEWDAFFQWPVTTSGIFFCSIMIHYTTVVCAPAVRLEPDPQAGRAVNFTHNSTSTRLLRRLRDSAPRPVQDKPKSTFLVSGGGGRGGEVAGE